MTLFQDTGGDPRAARALVADVLAWFGAVGDAAMGNAPGFALRKASLAVALAKTAGSSESEQHALYLAGRLHAIGAIGNRAFRKGDALPERVTRMESWDVPAQGARICETIAALPHETPDIVRWQHEAWDGTGYPDSLRWTGIPRPAQFLALADRYLHAADPEEVLGHIGLESGRAFNPETVRTFTMWFHLSAGDVEIAEMPIDGLLDAPTDAQSLLERFADLVDAHNAVDGRWRRVALLADATAASLALSDEELHELGIACRIFGAGEVDEPTVEDDAFDPLARLGVDHRARNARAASALALPIASLRAASAIVDARGEWFDGTGKPSGRARKDIPIAAGVLAAAIAFERLDRGERIDTTAGTQFDPAIVRALMEVAKQRA
ncbi:MAG TPA: HD domain-containing phosphohydrolase [Candidatus Acidoferrales bacterium]|nr:HD domain-containing phosphohydrolase [Candidatus Acidoferrales bacterium]